MALAIWSREKRQEYDTLHIRLLYVLNHIHQFITMWEQSTSVWTLKVSINPTFFNSFSTAVVFLPLLLQQFILGAVGHVITSAARLPAPLPSAVYGNSIGAENLLLDGQPLNWLGKREVQTCDGRGICKSIFLIFFWVMKEK